MLVSCTSSEKLLKKAQELAKQLNGVFSEAIHPNTPSYLFFDHDGLSFYTILQNKKPHRLHVDFITGKSGYRLAKNLTIKQPLAKAVGIRPGFRPDIMDVTGGLGQDSFVLASLGSTITIVERSPIIHALLQDGIVRALENPRTKPIIQRFSKIICQDSIQYLSHYNAPKPHTIYMDPMYPHSDKSALNKIEMRMIRSQVGDDMDSANLLEHALNVATNRVVVKRPKRAEPIDSKTKITSCIEMKNSRFDLYITQDKM